jgi:dCTP diphosphatase
VHLKNIDLNELEKAINQFVIDRNWEQFHSIKNLSIALSVEASELLEIFQWMSEAESNHIKADEAKMIKVRAEVADVMIYLIRICSLLDLDLEKIVQDKMAHNSEKYPVSKVYGSSKKYNEY